MYRALVFLGLALVVTGVVLGADRGLHERLPLQVPSPSFVRGAVAVGVALVAVGLVGLAVG